MNIQLLNDLTVDDIQNGTFPLEKVVDESLYYPASGIDGSPIRHWGLGVNSFIYVDWLTDRVSLLSEIQKANAFKGYGLLAYRDLSRSDLTPIGWIPQRPNSLDSQLYKINMQSAMHDKSGPFAIWAIFERLPEFTDQHGPSRFSFINIRGEACATYQAIYVANNVLPKIVTNIRPGTGFGGNFNNFEEVFMETMLMHQQGLPRHLLSWHSVGNPSNYFSDTYEVIVEGPFSKDGEPDMELTLFSRS